MKRSSVVLSVKMDFGAEVKLLYNLDENMLQHGEIRDEDILDASNVECTGSVPSIPLLRRDVSSGSGLLRSHLMSPGEHFPLNAHFLMAIQHSGIARARIRTMPTLGQHIGALKTQFTQAMAPPSDQVAQTSEVVQQTQGIADAALQSANVAQQETAWMKSDVKNVLREHFSKTSKINQQKLAEVANAFSEKVVASMTQAQSELEQQNMELERLRTELAQLKIAEDRSVENVRATSDTNVGEVKNVFSAVKEEVQLEKIDRQLDKR